MTYHTITIPQPNKRVKSIEEVSPQKLYVWSTRLYALMNLAWDYIDTICRLCIMYKIDGTKKIVRQIKFLKREYDKFRQPIVDTKYETNETNTGLEFENIFRKNFAKIAKSLTDVADELCIAGKERSLFFSVLQAVILMGAVKYYAKWCDKQIENEGVWVCDYCLVQTSFLALYPLIKKIMNMLPQVDEDVLKKHSRDIANRLHIFNKLPK